MESIAINNLSFFYPGCQTPALDNVTCRVLKGEFVTLCGLSGSGKSTLLRQIKCSLAPAGRRIGEILVDGTAVEAMDQREQSKKIGFILQRPEEQLVTDKVWHELAFGMENLGYESEVIRRRTAEMAAFFGIDSWFHREVRYLSGGQKQLLNLAAVMVLQPDILLLDEPTSQLDPIAASHFLQALRRINRELGTTVLLSEHRLEEAFPLSHRILVLEKGHVAVAGAPKEIGERLWRQKHPMFAAMPASVRLWLHLDGSGTCPITAGEGRRWFAAWMENRQTATLPEDPVQDSTGQKPLLFLDTVHFRYQKEQEDVLRGISLKIYPGEIYALLGGNGAGKSTALQLMAGVLQAGRGRVSNGGAPNAHAGRVKAAYLSQNPQCVFVKKTVREDFLESLPDHLDETARQKTMESVVRQCGLSGLLDRHPFDLSGGEIQRAALAKLLLRAPRLLLLDEPTKGMDTAGKQEIGRLLLALKTQGVTIVLASHDIEFCACFASRCGLLFDGVLAAEDTPRRFFSGNRFYTTAVHRMTKDALPEAVTEPDVFQALGQEPPVIPALCFRKDPDVFSAGAGAEGWPDTAQQGEQGLRREIHSEKQAEGNRGRRLLSVLAVCAVVLVTLFLGNRVFSDRKHLFISLLILLEITAAMFFRLEGKRPKARELLLLAALCAIGVAGRAAFFMLPQFKPVVALCILAGTAFGCEAGFLVGAATMFLSNMFLGQGPWTPYQMAAAGLIGFLAGLLFFKTEPGEQKVGKLCVYGGAATIFLYGGIMNFASAVLALGTVTAGTVLPYYISGFPMDIVHGIATVVFLRLGAKPILEKLERVKLNYTTFR